MERNKLIGYLLGCYFFTTFSLASPLKMDEHIVFLPDIAYQTNNNNTITIIIQAWVYEKERRPGMTTALTNYLGIKKSQLTPKQIKTLYERTQLVRVDSERNKHITIQLADQSIHALPATDENGRSSLAINTSIPITDSVHTVINYKLLQADKPLNAKGHAMFIPQVGISIISDIDDTIKESQVTNKKQLLINTFINEFKAVTGMSNWYNQLAKQGAAFHYVSSSPIQLYPALKTFMDNAKFPLGTFHLREATSWRNVIAKEGDSEQHKKMQIEKLLRTFPKRQFILVGDSGEADPEIYADIMRQYPTQIRYIAIRNITQEDNQAIRYQQTFKGLDKSKWTTFKNTPPLLSLK